MKVTIKKSKKKKLRTDLISGFFAVLLGATWFVSSLFMNATSTDYTMQIQNTQSEIAAIKEENNSLSIEIQTLQNKDRVYTIAQESGLTQNQANVVSIN